MKYEVRLSPLGYNEQTEDYSNIKEAIESAKHWLMNDLQDPNYIRAYPEIDCVVIIDTSTKDVVGLYNLHGLNRKELQAVAKKHGIKANLPSATLIAEIEKATDKFRQSEDSFSSMFGEAVTEHFSDTTEEKIEAIAIVQPPTVEATIEPKQEQPQTVEVVIPKLIDTTKQVNRLGGVNRSLRGVINGVTPHEALASYSFLKIPLGLDALPVNGNITPAKVANHLLEAVSPKSFIPTPEKQDREGFIIKRTKLGLENLLEPLDNKTVAYLSHPIRLLAYLIATLRDRDKDSITWEDNQLILSQIMLANLKELASTTKFNNSALTVEGFRTKQKIALGNPLDKSVSGNRLQESPDKRRRASIAKNASATSTPMLGSLLELHPALWRKVANRFYIRLNSHPYLPKTSWNLSENGKLHNIRLEKVNGSTKKAVLSVNGKSVEVAIGIPNALIQCKNGNKYRVIVRHLPDSFPNIADIEITETPYAEDSWKRIGRLICGRKNQLVCLLDKDILQQNSPQADLILTGLKLLGLMAQSPVKPERKSFYADVITDYSLPEVQALLGVTLEHDANNPTIPYTVKKLAYSRKDLYTLDVRMGI